MDAVAQSRAIITHHSKSFSMASALLHRRHRDDVAVVYAWCRRADDAIDLADPKDHPAILAELKRELHAVYTGDRLDDPILQAFQQVVCRHGVPREYPAELLAGMEMDVHKSTYDTMDDLLLYCYRVAGTVGLMMCHVLGVRHSAALVHAAHLGIAMQITNICRDVAEDWNRGRLYIPQSLLRAHGVRPLLPDTPNLDMLDFRNVIVACVGDLLAVADGYYRSADAGLEYLSWRSALAVRTARYVYAAIGGKLARRGFDCFAGRAYVSRAGKCRFAAQAAAQAVAEIPGRLRRRFHPVTINGIVHFPNDVLPLKTGAKISYAPLRHSAT